MEKLRKIEIPLPDRTRYYIVGQTPGPSIEGKSTQVIAIEKKYEGFNLHIRVHVGDGEKAYRWVEVDFIHGHQTPVFSQFDL